MINRFMIVDDFYSNPDELVFDDGVGDRLGTLKVSVTKHEFS